MKVVHKPRNPQVSKVELLHEAKEAEESEEWKQAIELYGQVLDLDPHNEAAYNRLMIVYRKERKWKEELQTVKNAIDAFEEMYESIKKPPQNKKISRLSNSLLKITGLADRKGKPIYQPGPLAKWKRRRAVLEKKLKKS
jgi:tetratricopeptide (TPR) repeat protein